MGLVACKSHHILLLGTRCRNPDLARPPPCSPPLCLDAPRWLLLKAAGVRDGTVPDRLPSSTVPPHLLTPGPDLTSALEPAMRRSTLTSHPGWESLMGLTACKSLELN